MSMFNDIIWWNKDKETECVDNSTLVSLFAKRFPAGRWSFLGFGSEIKWYSTNKERPGGKWDRAAELMWIKFGESGHPVFRATTPFSRGTLNRKWSIHFCADGDTIETVFRTIISVNQISIYGAVSDFVWTVAVEQEQGDLLWQSNPTHSSHQQTYCWWHLDFRLRFPHKKFIAELQGTSGKASTTRSIDKSLYWCRIPENSWSRTILLDKTYWRVLTICKASDMSWVRFTKGWKIIWSERLDSREHQNWTRNGSHNQLFAR